MQLEIPNRLDGNQDLGVRPSESLGTQMNQKPLVLRRRGPQCGAAFAEE